jgi:hypothetical protein
MIRFIFGIFKADRFQVRAFRYQKCWCGCTLFPGVGFIVGKIGFNISVDREKDRW